MTGEAASATQLLGTYELLRPLAHGGMADIFLARREDGVHVALKVLSDHRVADHEACTMFLDEGRVVALLDHPNVARVFDVAVTDQGDHYLAMEYVHGADLRQLLTAAAHAQRIVPYETSIAIVMSAAAGLDHAHRRCDLEGRPLRLVHRDVSLSNLMVGHDGIVKVVDFGIASTTMATIHTCPGVVRGKASYMSPEQCLGDELDHRTDVFALGVVLYELTTGARCFTGKTDFDRMLAVVRGDFIAPRDIIADFPEDLESVIRRALSTDAGKRFASAAALIEALSQVLAAHGWTGGRTTIVETMRELFGDVPEPWMAISNEPTRNDLAAVDLAGETARTPRLARGTDLDLARGSVPDLEPKWAPTPAPALDDDQPTRGRRTFKRPPTAPNIRL